MTLREKILSMRLNEFGFSKVCFLGSDKDVFPQQIDIVKWEETEPRRVFSLNEMKYIESTSYCFVIGTLKWNEKEPCWEFESTGTRYLEYGTEELNKWLLDFCNKYEVCDNEIVEVSQNKL